MLRLVLFVPLLAGCPEVATDDSPWGSSDGSGLPDADGDGFDTESDCDDANADVHPEAVELCDDVDQDCDGEIDEGAGSAWFIDADGDGFGDESAKRTACEQPSGYVSDATDCNDADAAYHPGAPEASCSPSDPDYNCNGVPDVGDSDADGADGCDDCDDANAEIFPGNPELCDGLDNDCNGDVDDGIGAGTTFFEDADGDDYGNPFSFDEACVVPPGFVDNDDDCDDALPSVHPGASEYCNAYDDDCDGEVDESGALDASAWFADADADGYGDSKSVTTGCAAPSGYVADNSDCADANPDIHPGADEYCGGTDYDCDGSANESDSVDVVPYYSDADADGYAGTEVGKACFAPTGYFVASNDCDDTDSEIHLGADDICDAKDNDCDGVIDDGLRVPTDYSTISAAIAASRDHDSVCVETGDYYEDIDFDGKNITLEGEGSGITTVHGSATGPVARIDSGEWEATLRGFTLTGGESSQGAGLYVYNTSPTLDDLVISGNTCTRSSYCYGTGLYVYGSPIATDITVTSNYATTLAGSYNDVYGAGAYIVSASGIFSGITVADNWGDISAAALSGGVYGGGLYVSDSSASFDNVTISGNVCYRSGGAAISYAYGYGCGIATLYSAADFDDVTVYFNESYLAGKSDYTYGAAWYTYNDASSLSHIKIVANTADSYAVFGAAIYADYYSTTTFTNVQFIGNIAGYYSAGTGAYGTVYADYGSTPSFENVDIVGNKLSATYAYGGGLYAGYRAAPTVVNSSVYNNVLSGSYVTGGAIMGYSSTSTVSCAYSNFYGNSAAEFYNVSSPVGTDGNLAVSPDYVDLSSSDASAWDLSLSAGSALIDAGDPSISDADGSTSDIGSFGGPAGSGW